MAFIIQAIEVSQRDLSLALVSTPFVLTNMVSLDIIEASNNRIKSTLPAGIVAVFVGATNGVGETTVKQFATHVVQPRVYIVGRSQEAGDRITAECKELNPEGTFIFLQRDTSLMRNVDEICEELASKEEVLDLLFLSIGTLQNGSSESTPATQPCSIANLTQRLMKGYTIQRP